MPGKLTSAGIGNLKRLGKFYDGTHGLFGTGHSALQIAEPDRRWRE